VHIKGKHISSAGGLVIWNAFVFTWETCPPPARTWQGWAAGAADSHSSVHGASQATPSDLSRQTGKYGRYILIEWFHGLVMSLFVDGLLV